MATSSDGTHFSWQGEVLGVGEGWDAYQARLSSVVAFGGGGAGGGGGGFAGAGGGGGGGFAGYYDGAGSPAEDTEERCGVAVSTDLRTWRQVTAAGPALVSPHATGSLRYVEAVRIDGASVVYYEYARPDGSHELRRNLLVG